MKPKEENRFESETQYRLWAKYHNIREIFNQDLCTLYGWDKRSEPRMRKDEAITVVNEVCDLSDNEKTHLIVDEPKMLMVSNTLAERLGWDIEADAQRLTKEQLIELIVELRVNDE